MGKLSQKIDSYFEVTKNSSTFSREFRAGTTTFLAMASILFINPALLHDAITTATIGQLLTATAVTSAIACIFMGLWARYPFALAPGMGLNAYFAYTLVVGGKIPWQTALGMIFVAGILLAILSFGGIRKAVIKSLPPILRQATLAGVGLFIIFIGLKNSHFVISNPDTILSAGAFSDPQAKIALVSLVVMAIFTARKTKGAILLGIILATVVAILSKASVYSTSQMGVFSSFPGFHKLPVQWPEWPSSLIGALRFRDLWHLSMLPPILTILCVGIFDAAGTLISLGAKGNFLTKDGEMPRLGRAFSVDALTTPLGAFLGTSTMTTYVESVAGMEEGGRTGLTAITVGIFFILSLFFWPLLTLVPLAAIAPALIIVGIMMLSSIQEIKWDDASQSIPLFLSMVFMGFTFNIAHGISVGIIAYTAVQVAVGKYRQVNLAMYVITLALIARYIWLPIS